VDVLKKFAKNHQNLLYPVFKLQHHLQENVLGANFWIKASQRRVQLSKGKYVTLEELMQLVRLLHVSSLLR
jgi:deoxyinosine 3'endonuclease (endonuclease V)